MRDPEIWVPAPTAAERYVVRIDVYDGDRATGN